MPVSSPSSTRPISESARALALVATAALLFLIVILITGGTSFDVGPLHLSARRWRGPLIVSAVAWLAAVYAAGGEWRQIARAVHDWLDLHATTLALVIAAGAAGVGIGYGTYAAAGADASGYISQADLLATGHTTFHEPLADRFPALPNRRWAVAPFGYRPGSTAGEMVPTYPPGLPLVMAGARVVAGATASYLIVPLLGGCAVFWTYVLGARLFSRLVGLSAAVLLATSPIFLFQVVQPMSDVPATAWWLLAFVFTTTPVPLAAMAAGAASGLAVLTRPNLFPLALAVIATLAVRHRERPFLCAFQFLVGLLPAAGALLLLQWRLYGSPLTSGYGSFDELFSLASVWPNLLGYSGRLVRGEMPALGLLIASMALWPLANNRAGQRPQPSLRAATTLAVATGAILLACYLPYAVFSEWFYLRFLLPALPFLFIAIAAVTAVVTSRFRPGAAGIAMLIAITIAGAFNVRAADREQAFHLRDFDARYRLAGKYLSSSLPPSAVLVTVQESGSLHHYTGRPVLRWDQAGSDLDAVLASVRAAGWRPILVIEDWEAAGLRDKFPTSTVARLDWAPRATIPGPTTVRIFDPADREAAIRGVEDIVR